MEIHISTYGKLDAVPPGCLLKKQYCLHCVFPCFCKPYILCKHVGLPRVSSFCYIDLSDSFSAHPCCFGYYSFAVCFESRYISVMFRMFRIALAILDLLWLLTNVTVDSPWEASPFQRREWGGGGRLGRWEEGREDL